MTPGPKVFISYRRDEPGNYARQIYRWVSENFGAENVFIDVVTLKPGTDWVEEITTSVQESRVLLVVIGPQWAGLAKADEGEQDWVALEVQLALKRPDTSVIPVLVGKAEMPKPSELPASLQKLPGRTAHRLHDDFWEPSLDQLGQALESRGMQRLRPGGPSTEPIVDEGRDGASLAALVLQGVALAFAAGLLANWLVTELMPSPADQDTEAASIAVAVARRTVTWAIVGTALALWLALSYRGDRHVPPRTIFGLLLGALAGAIGGGIDALPDITNQDLGSWVDPVALGATGALVGALVGGGWQPPHAAYGMAAGGAAGVLVQLVFSHPANPGENAVRVALIAGLVLVALAALATAREAAVRGRPAGANLPPPHAH